MGHLIEEQKYLGQDVIIYVILKFTVYYTLAGWVTLNPTELHFSMNKLLFPSSLLHTHTSNSLSFCPPIAPPTLLHTHNATNCLFALDLLFGSLSTEGRSSQVTLISLVFNIMQPFHFTIKILGNGF